MSKPRAKYWFWAWTVLGTVHKHRKNKPTAPCEVWENFILQIATPNEALRKAEMIGRSDAGDVRGSLRLISPAASVFGALINYGRE
jgi:hypothetical protein